MIDSDICGCKVTERPVFQDQILDPAELSPGMRIGVQTVADGRIHQATLTVAEINHAEEWVAFVEWKIPKWYEGEGNPQPYAFGDLGLAAYEDGRWHRVHYCFTIR